MANPFDDVPVAPQSVAYSDLIGTNRQAANLVWAGPETGSTKQIPTFRALVAADIGGVGAAHIIQDEGVSLTARAKLNFIGAIVTVTDNAGANSTDVTMSTVGTGTVTSVGFAVAKDATRTISNTPVTTSGTLTDTAVDANADKLVGWDDSADSKIYFTLGTGLSTSGTTLNASAGTVTSVALSVVNDDTRAITGSPVTTSGTLTDTAVDANADKFVFWDDSAGKKVYGTVAGNIAIVGTVLQHSECWCIELGDETTVLTTGTGKRTFRMPYAATLTAVRASLTTVSSSGIPTFDINESGTTVLSTKLTIDASEKTSTTAATAAVISDSALADDAEITIDCDVAGTGATGAKIYMYIQKT